MKHSVRNANNGRFTRAENTFKGIEVGHDRKYQPIPYGTVFLIMVIIFGILGLLDYFGVINVVPIGE
jgi:hypothetical protein